MSEPKLITPQQRKSIWLYSTLMAYTFNDAGLDCQRVIEVMQDGVEVQWTKELFMELVWRRMQIAALGKHSITTLTTENVTTVFDHVNRLIGDKFEGIPYVPFPSIEEQYWKTMGVVK